MPYNIKQLGEKSVSIDFFIADPSQGDEFICQRDEFNCKSDEFNCQNL